MNENRFQFSDSNKRYHTLNYHNKSLGIKLFKAAVNCGFTCPNIDGTCGRGGCIYCSEGSRLFTNDSALSVTRQLELEKERIHQKNPDAFLCAYFQSNTNTYAPVEVLKAVYDEAAAFPGVKTISVATRSDCIPDDVLEVLTGLNERIPVTVELGLQTVHDRTAKIINRGYTLDVFDECFDRLKKAGLRTCVHIIDGLPGESYEDMLETARQTGLKKPDAMKIHLLYVVKGTVLERMYLDGKYTPMILDDYTQTVANQLRYIPPETVIERITGDADKRTLVAPMWSTDKIRVLGTIDLIMAQNDYFQGDLTSGV